MIKISHQRDKCIGCNSCVEICPSRWKMNIEDGKSILLESEQKGEFFNIKVGEDEYEANKLAAESCPVNIIHVDKT